MMRTVSKYSLLIVGACLLSGCTQKPPKCGDPNTIPAVKKSLVQQIGAIVGMSPAELDANLVLDSHRAVGFDKEINKYSCEARLTVAQNAPVGLRYDSQLDEQKQHLVMVNSADVTSTRASLTALVSAKAPAEDTNTGEVKKPSVKISPEIAAILNTVYKKYDDKKQCWIATHPETMESCLTPVQLDVIDTGTEKRNYLVLAGSPNDEGSSGRANAGIAGVFIISDKNGVKTLTSSNPNILSGSSGLAETDWKLVQLGADNYYGWQTESGFAMGGWATYVTEIFAPYGLGIKKIATYQSAEDNTGACDEPKCLTKTKVSMSPSSDLTKKVFPLTLTLTGSKEGKVFAPQTYTLPFNDKKWEYVVPKALEVQK